MGYYPHHINYFGITLEYEDVDVDIDKFEIALNASPFVIIDGVGSFNGADSRIHEMMDVFCFKKYTYFPDRDLSGDITAAPSIDEINDMKSFCTEYAIKWSEPSRQEISYIL